MDAAKTIAIHQPNFFPWLGYFYKIAHCDVFVILDNVDFQQGNHNSITNRTKIKCQGEELFLTINVKRNPESKLIKDIVIDKQSTNLKKILKTISYNYSKSTHYSTIYPLLEEQLNLSWQQEKLCDFNSELIRFVCKLLEINTKLVVASKLDLSLTGRNERIIEICKKLDGTVYFSGYGGKEYHDESLFQKNDITIKYTSFEQKEYKQLQGNFLNGLSVLDVLMNCGTNKVIEFIS